MRTWTSQRACVHVCPIPVPALQLRRVAMERETDAQVRALVATEAEDLRLRLEAELWEVAKQLQEKKR